MLAALSRAVEMESANPRGGVSGASHKLWQYIIFEHDYSFKFILSLTTTSKTISEMFLPYANYTQLGVLWTIYATYVTRSIQTYFR